MDKSMAELVLLAQAGDQSAVSQLYERSYSSVYQAVRALIQDEDQAQDIVQDSFIKGFRELDNLGDPEKFVAWMKVIAGNCARDWLRKRRPVLFSERVDENGEEIDLRHPDDCPDHMPEEVIDRQETARLIDQILGKLSPEQRMAVIMYYYEELSIRQIAGDQGCSENTVKSRLKYARDKIEKEVRDLEKKGTKLYALEPMDFFKSLLRMAGREGISRILEGLGKAGAAVAGAAVVEEAGSAVAKKVAEKAAGDTVGEVLKAAGKTAGKAVAKKVAAGILAVTVTAGAGVVAVNTVTKPETVDLNAEAHEVYEDFLDRYVYAYAQGDSAVFAERDRYWDQISGTAMERYPDDVPVTFGAWKMEYVPGRGFRVLDPEDGEELGTGELIPVPESWYDINMDDIFLVSTSLEEEEVRYAYHDFDGEGVDELVIAKFYRNELLTDRIFVYRARDGQLYRGQIDWDYVGTDGSTGVRKYSWTLECDPVHTSCKPRAVDILLGKGCFDEPLEVAQPDLEWHFLFGPGAPGPRTPDEEPLPPEETAEEPHVHAYSEEVTAAPACNAAGVKTFRCDCGESYTEELPMLEHAYTVSTVASTCTVMGYDLHTCTLCGHSYRDNYAELLPHQDVTVETPATCTEGSYVTFTCTVCGNTEIGHRGPSLGGHKGTWQVVRDATETSEGLRERICTVCGEKETETIPMR